MRIERSMHPDFLSNTYLVVNGDRAFFVDAGGPVQPLIDLARAEGITPEAVLLTHHHYDHVCELDALKAEWPDMRVLADPREPLEDVEDWADGEYAGLDVKALHTPGHCAGMLALVVEGTDVFTGDTLFKNSVGGVRAPGSTSYADLKSSVMDTLMGLDHGITIRPGHTDPSTIGDEWESNPFVRVWRGLDPEGDESCTAMGESATLVLLGPDYDGGHKAWVRWADGRDDIVPGSQVQR